MGILDRLFGKKEKSDFDSDAKKQQKNGSYRKDFASTKCAFCGKIIIGEVKVKHHNWWCGECEGEFKSKKTMRIKEELKEGGFSGYNILIDGGLYKLEPEKTKKIGKNSYTLEFRGKDSFGNPVLWVNIDPIRTVKQVYEKNLIAYWIEKIEQMRSNPSLLISELATDSLLKCENCGQTLLKKSDIWMDMDYIPPKICTLMRSDTLMVGIGEELLNIATPYRAGKCTDCNAVYCFGCVQKKGKLITEVERGWMKYSCIKCGNKISII